MSEKSPHSIDSPVYSKFAEDADFRELLEPFLESLHEQRQEILSAYENQQWGELGCLAHQLKGAGGGYGFPGLSERAKALEDCFQQEDEKRIQSCLDHLLAYIDRLHA